MRLVALFICFGLFTSSAFCQQTFYFNDPQASYKRAKEYFQKGFFSLALPIFQKLESELRSADRSNKTLYYQDICYYTIVCGLKQNELVEADEASEYIATESNKARVEMISFELAEYYFRKSDYADAITLYESAGIENLDNEQVADLKFHEGYVYFSQARYELAKPLFNTVRQLPGNHNYVDANYYYGFICFYDKSYSQALEAFKIVENQPKYDKVVPYYLANIYIIQGQRDKAIEYAQKKVDNGGQYYDMELRQLVGHGYYENQQFDKALPYLEQYVAQSQKVSPEDLYELSYCYYETKDWKKAIGGFKKLSGKSDSLSQNSTYLLGDAYLKTGQKENARNAFLFCSTNNGNLQQREVSKFNYAKLSDELGYQDIALKELQLFIEQYPNSTYIVEARDLLVSLLANTNNYKDALAMVDSLGATSERTKKISAKILLGRATELINDDMLLAANDLLDKALRQPDNQSVLPFIDFWKGEIDYRLNRIDEAIRYFFEYLKSSSINDEVNPGDAKYNLGYCFLKKENYHQAQGFFEQIVRTPRINSEPLAQDAYIRDADCFYMDRDFKTSLAMYNKILDFSWPASDYATFQKAMIAGVNNGNEKISLLNSIPRKYPSSGLIPDANMEIAITYLADEQFREALPYLKNIIGSTGADALKPRAYLKAGIAYYNLNNNDLALAQYDALVKQYPNSQEAQDAMENAKTIYVEEGKSSDYVNFAKNMGVDITPNQEDQLAYDEAEVQFNNGNFSAAAPKFEQYLAKFPEGKYFLEANYYKSEIYYNQKNWTKAVTGYEAVADRAPNQFAQKSLLQAAQINFFNLKDYATAEKYFAKLKDFASGAEEKMEAMRGLLRCQYQLGQWKDAVDNAKDLLNQKGLGTDDRVMANLAIAKSYETQNQCESALQYFRIAASLSKAAYGAEARYEIANCLLEQNALKDAEKEAFEVIHKAGSYELWVTKAYILLGDIYTKEKDYFNARATFQSVVENAKIEELRQQAQQKLEQLPQDEKTGGKSQDNQ